MGSFSILGKIPGWQCENAREPWRSASAAEVGQRTTRENTSVLPPMTLECLCPTKSCSGSPVRSQNTLITIYMSFIHFWYPEHTPWNIGVISACMDGWQISICTSSSVLIVFLIFSTNSWILLFIFPPILQRLLCGLRRCWSQYLWLKAPHWFYLATPHQVCLLRSPSGWTAVSFKLPKSLNPLLFRSMWHLFPRC